MRAYHPWTQTSGKWHQVNLLWAWARQNAILFCYVNGACLSLEYRPSLEHVWLKGFDMVKMESYKRKPAPPNSGGPTESGGCQQGLVDGASRMRFESGVQAPNPELSCLQTIDFCFWQMIPANMILLLNQKDHSQNFV